MFLNNYIDISNCQQNEKYYGGLSCLKMGVTLDNVDYIVKLPGNLKDKNLRNVILSYSNAPICEYIGSHIYESLGIKVHDTTLATYNGKVVVLCKDFLNYGDTLYEFRQIKSTYPKGFLTKTGEASDGTGSDLDEALIVIRDHIAFKKLTKFEDHFWNMFIVDAIIGNGDRNNGNYGIIQNGNSSCIAPVFDNGNCLNPTWDDNKMKKALISKDASEIYRGKTCFFTRDDKKLNPFQIIASGEFEACSIALDRIINMFNLDYVDEMIDAIKYASSTQKEWYKYIIRARIDYLKTIDISTIKEMHTYANVHFLDYQDLIGRIYRDMPTMYKTSTDKEICAMQYWNKWKELQI